MFGLKVEFWGPICNVYKSVCTIEVETENRFHSRTGSKFYHPLVLYAFDINKQLSMLVLQVQAIYTVQELTTVPFFPLLGSIARRPNYLCIMMSKWFQQWRKLKRRNDLKLGFILWCWKKSYQFPSQVLHVKICAAVFWPHTVYCSPRGAFWMVNANIWPTTN